MIEDLKRTIKQTSVYSLGNILPKLVGFLLLPLYTDKLSTFEFGVLAILQASSQILVGVFGFNIHTAMIRWLAIKEDENYRKSIVFTSAMSTLIVSLIMCVLFIPFSSSLSYLLFGHYRFNGFIILLVISSALGIINNIPLNILRFQEQAIKYTLASVVKFIFILFFNFYFLLKLNLGINGILIAEINGGIILIIQTSYHSSKHMNLTFNYNASKDMFAYGFPLIFSTASTLLLSLSDRYILAYFLDESSVGIYSLGSKIAGFINVFIIQSFQLGFLPIAFKKLNDENAKRFFIKVFTYFNLLLIISALTLSIFNKEIITTFASRKEYWEAYSVIPLLSFAFVLKGSQYMLSLGFHYTQKTSYNAYIVMITAILNVVLNILLIPLISLMGAAWAFFISSILLLIITNFYSQKLYPVKYEFRKIAKAFFLAMFLYLISSQLFFSQFYLTVIIKLIILFAFPILLYPVGFYEKIELEKLSSYLKKLFKIKTES
ncbi:MAG: oligosaccharide flippase family protein [Ignavibacteriales bacterium]